MTSVTLYGSLAMIGITVLQSTLLRFVEIAGVAPDLVLIVLIFVANRNGSMTGQITGFVAGVVLDLVGLSPLGFHAVIYTLIGALFGVTRGKMFVDPIFTPVILALVAMVMKGLLALLISVLFSTVSVRGQLFSSAYAIEMIYTALLGPLAFGLLGTAHWLQPDRRRGDMI